MAKQSKAVPATPATPVADRDAPRHVINAPGVVTLTGKPNHSPQALEGLKAGKAIKDAEGSVHKAWISAARTMLPLDESNRVMFIEGFGSAWMNTATAKVRMSELRTIVSAMSQNATESERIIGNLLNGSLSRVEFMAEMRKVSPKVTGQGARTDTPQAAAATSGQSTGEAVKEATKRADAAKITKATKAATKMAKARPGPVIDAATSVLPAATAEQQAKVISAVASAVTPAPDAAVKLIGFIMQMAGRLADIATDQPIKDYATGVVSDSALILNRMKAGTAAAPDAAASKAKQRKAA